MTKKAPIKRIKKAPKKAASKKGDKRSIESILVQKFPCEPCLAINVAANVTNDGSFALHMHVGCAHAIATSFQTLDKMFQQAGDEMEAAREAKENTKAGAPPAPTKPSAPTTPVDPAFM